MKINVVVIIIVAMGVLLRIIPHMPNFAPVAAIALFSGVYFSKKMAIALPVILLFVSDIFIGFYEPKLMISVYVSFILCGFLGLWLKNHKRWRMILGCSICSSFVFFILTNFTVFAFTPWYPKTIFGITQCYLMALPFFRNTLLGDLFYIGVFFGAYELADILIKKYFKLAIIIKKSNTYERT